MAPNPRVAKAFHAMRNLGIPEEKTKQVLKNLLKIYEKNWELIEEENYRALADAIFDSEEAEAAEQKKKHDNAEAAEKKKNLEQTERLKATEEETLIQEAPERPLNRLCLRQQDGQASVSSINPSTNSSRALLKRPKLEVDELPEVQPHLKSHSEPVRFKEPKVEPEDEPLDDKSPWFEVPAAVIMPETSTNGDASTENNMVREPNRLLPLTSVSSENMELGNNTQTTSNEASYELIDIPEKSTTSLDIASSSSGKIKISLSCKSAHGKPKLSVTSVDTVLKTMEDKCQKSYKVLDPNFSVKKFMKDICEGLLDLESDSTGEPPVDMDCMPPKDPLETYAVDDECMPSKGRVNVGDPLQRVIDSTGNDCVTQVNQNEFENMESFDDVNDIAKGQESMIISLVNDVNSECPPSFHYIPQSAVFQNAYIDFSLARIVDDNCCPTCFGDCLTSSTPCPCAQQSGGEFAYTTEGLVKEALIDEVIKTNRDPQKHRVVYYKVCPLERLKNEEIVEPCKGHSVRSFIKECWLKCGCSKKCGNRVVQCGIKYKLQVFMTSGGKGWGLRALEDLPKGAFICEYVGEVLTITELYSRVSQSLNKDEYAHPVLLDADWSAESELKDEETLYLDATYYGNVARFINHRCFDPSLVEIPVEVDNPDHHYYHVAFFTTRKVKALEELTRDYGIDFDDPHPVKAFQCLCGSHFCRDIKHSSRSRKRT